MESSSLAKLDEAIEALRKDIAEFQDLVAATCFIPGEPMRDAARVLTKTPPKTCPCKVHRRYTAQLKPRGTCSACWDYYLEMHK